MSPAVERWTRIKELFAATTDLAPAERSAFLDRECGPDTGLRLEIEALLSADAADDLFLDQPVLSLPPDLFPEAPGDETIGKRFGAYEMIERIGRGGLGTVYLAERADDVFHKQVAVKVVRRGLDTEDILERLRHERQILAQLEHPNIARLLDGGSTESGAPYFVMEYVAGEPLLACCVKHNLTVEQRLQLFRKICAAVTYAHQNLVIHRDLKPSNILVSGDGEPKLLDFGIAKLLTPGNDDITLTGPAQRVMTLDYASPEQIRGDRVTTTSDVYSLGVILYEMLAGQKPYHLRTGTPGELDATYRAVVGAEVINPRLNRDLSNIILMAMRLEPERRYTSAAELSEDIRRHLEGLPVQAHKDTFGYRAAKFVRRNKAAVSAAALIVAAVVTGVAGTLWQARAAWMQRARAEKRFADVRRLANSYLFDVYPQIENLEGSLKAREAILKNALTYLDSLAREAAGDRELQAELATAYEKVGDVQGALNNSNLGNAKAGLESYAKARALRTAVLEANSADLEAREKLADNYYTTARTFWNNNQNKEAEEAFEKAVALRRELVAARPDSPQYLDRLAVTLIDYGAIPAFNAQSQKALKLFDEALAINEKLRKNDPANATFKKTEARLLRILSKPRTALGDYPGALQALERALSVSKEVAQQFPDDFRAQRAVWLTESMICEVYIDKGEGASAVKRCGGSIEFPKKALAHEPENGVVTYDLAISYFNLARAHRLAGDFAETIRNADEAVAAMVLLSAKSPENQDYKRNLAIYKSEKGRAQLALNRSDDALVALGEALQILEPIIEADRSSATYQEDLAVAYRLSAQAHHQKGDDDVAVELIDKAIAVVRRMHALQSYRESDKNTLAEMEQEKRSYSR